LIREFTVPGFPETFFAADALSEAAQSVPRGRIFLASEVRHLKNATLSAEERIAVLEAKLIFSGEVVWSGEGPEHHESPKWVPMPTKRKPRSGRVDTIANQRAALTRALAKSA
jgi:hypothetical protein